MKQMSNISKIQSMIDMNSNAIMQYQNTMDEMNSCISENAADGYNIPSAWREEIIKIKKLVRRMADHQRTLKLQMKDLVNLKPKTESIYSSNKTYCPDTKTLKLFDKTNIIDNFISDFSKFPSMSPVKIDPIDTTMKNPYANPKDIIGSDKLPLHLWPTTASAMGCIGMLNGALKYGRSNFREAPVRASIYVDACKRHLDNWFEGEENDSDDNVPHLAAALSCLAIIVDAKAAGKLVDDRMISGGYKKLTQELTLHVKSLKLLHKEKSPKHFTIADNQ